MTYDEILLRLNARRRRKATLLAEIEKLDADIDYLQAQALDVDLNGN